MSELGRLGVGLLAHPGSAFHELLPLEVAGLHDAVESSDPLLEQLVFFGQHASLPFSLIVAEQVLLTEGCMVVLGSQHVVECPGHVLWQSSRLVHQLVLETLLEFHHLDVVLVSDSGDLFQMSVLEDGVSFTKEVVHNQSRGLSATRDFEHLLSVLLDEREDLSRNGLVVDVDLVSPLGLSHESGRVPGLVGAVLKSHHAAITYGGWSLLALQQGALRLAYQLVLLLSQVQESRPVGAEGDSLVPSRLLVSLLHHHILLATGRFLQGSVLHLLSHAKVVNQSLLLVDLTLLASELILHSLELLGKELVLLAELLTSHSQLLVLLLSVNQLVSDSAEFLFSLVDLVHVATGFESALLDKLFG